MAAEKKKVCQNFLNTGKCRFGDNCHCLHGHAGPKSKPPHKRGVQGLEGKQEKFRNMARGGAIGQNPAPMKHNLVLQRKIATLGGQAQGGGGTLTRLCMPKT